MASAIRFSDQAIGIISNHGDHHFYPSQWHELLSHGIRHFVYLGPLARLDDADDVLSLMETHNLRIVYGEPETLRTAAGSRELPAGEASLELHGVVFRYFLPSPNGETRVRFWDTQWRLSPELQRSWLLMCLKETGARILVIGSGLNLLHVVCDLQAQYVIHERQESSGGWPVWGESNLVHLDPHSRHVILTPSSRTHCCCILDPESNLLVGYGA